MPALPVMSSAGGRVSPNGQLACGGEQSPEIRGSPTPEGEWQPYLPGNHSPSLCLETTSEQRAAFRDPPLGFSGSAWQQGHCW